MKAGSTYLWKLDVVALVDAQADPVENALAGIDVNALENQSSAATPILGILLELLLPDVAEQHGGIGRELVEERHQGLIFACAGPDGDELLILLATVGLQPMFKVKERWLVLRIA